VSSRFQAPPGTYDVLPREQPLRQWITGEFELLCGLYGYRPIQTPVLEHADLFIRTSGESSDVVRKEMYSFVDRGNRSLTLRAEATAPIMRAYLQHGLDHEPQPQKLYTIASIFRYGRPQKGRFREHWQLDVEAIGSHDAAIDAEVIQLYDALLKRLGVTGYELELNSIGDPSCRPAYLERLGKWLTDHDSKLDDETREQARSNPLRALDNLAAKPRDVQAVLQQAPAIGDSLCGACQEHFVNVRRSLDAYGLHYTLVPTLVRGLDYYTRTTWEFVAPGGGSTGTLSGGGRYDGLAEELGGRPTPGVGFGAGLERLVLAVQSSQATKPPQRLPTEPKLDVFFAVSDGARRELVQSWLQQLRARGVSSDTEYAGRTLKKQLSHAARLGAATTVIVGPDGASIRRVGKTDEDVGLDEVPERLGL
jgi:histidyl-tRNA synthetase